MSFSAIRLKELSPEARLIAGFALAFAMLIAVGVVQYRSIQALIETDGWVAHTHTVVAELEAVYSGLQQAESGTRGYLVTGQQDYLQQQEAGIANARDHFRTLQTLIADNPQQKRNLDRLALPIERKTAVMQHLVALRRDQDFGAASQELRKGEGLRLMNQIRAQVEDMKAVENGLLQGRQTASRRSARVANALTALGTLLAVAFMLVAAWITRRDALERRQAQEALQSANAYNRSLLEASLDPLVTISPVGKVTDVNEAATRVTGVPRQELVGTDFGNYFTEPDKARKGYQRVFSKGFVTDYPLTIHHVDGCLTDVLYNASVYKDTQGHVLGVFAAARDVTALKQASEYARSLLEASLDPLVTIAPDGKITDVNKATEQATGLTRQELVGSDFSDYFTDPQKARAGYQQVYREGWVQDYELEVRHRDGHATPVVYNASLYRDGSGKVMGVFAAARDITERKRAEEALQEYSAELARSNADLQQFAYVASHDLQEPLRMVGSYTQLLAKRYKGKLDADADDFIGYAVDGARRMQGLINDLLLYSRVGTRGQALAFTNCEGVLEEAITNLQAAIEETSAEVTHAPLPMVWGDASQLAQVFQNLIGNALKFHGPEPPRVHISTENRDAEWRFAVRDNGIGIDPQYADRIFVIFQRLHTLAEYPGAGMGLAITKKIIERHGGRIWVESEPGKGCTFHFTIQKQKR